MGLSTNTFEGGMNKDSNPKGIESNQYFNANDISITSDNTYGAIKPIAGSLSIYDLLSGSLYGINDTDFKSSEVNDFINLMGIAQCKVKKNGINSNGFCVFISRAENLEFSNLSGISRIGDNDIFEIYLGGLDSFNNIDFVEKVYSKIRKNSKYLTSTVDFEVAGDRDLDTIYLTNQVDTPYRIRCTLDEFTTSNPLFNEENISLVRKANARPPSPVIKNGGGLLAGSYQFASRMINSSSNSYSKWSLLSNPVAIAAIVDSNGKVNPPFLSSSNTSSGVVGEITDKLIELNITFNQDIAYNYDYYQVAIIKNITGTGIGKLVASIVEPKEKVGSFSLFTYYGNEEESEIDINEIVVDDAQVENFGTISIKNNFLIAGNILYADLSYDNLDPEIDSSTDSYISDINIDSFDLNKENSQPSSNDSNFYYFRDEVYRIGITYHDSNGNWSSPKVLDFSNVNNNKAEQGCIDWRTPSLEEEPLTSNSSGKLYGLGINLKGIKNHPSWAKGFAIVRAKRIKDLQFQSPLIPTQIVQPMIANTVYPQAGDPVNVDAQPPSSTFGTIVPKNFRSGVPKHILRGDKNCQYYHGYPKSIPPQAPDSSTTALSIGTFWEDVSAFGCQYVNILFPPNNIYNHDIITYEPYVHSVSDKIEIVDIQRLHGIKDIAKTSNFSVKIGNNKYANDFTSSDNQVVTQYAPQITDNYVNRSKANSPLSSLTFVNNDDNNVLEYQEIQTGQSKATLISSVEGLFTNTFGDYEGLKSPELLEGSIPINQKMGIVVTSKPISDIAYKFFDDVSILPLELLAAGYQNNPGFIHPLMANNVDQSINYPLVSSQFSHDAMVSIVNVRKGLTDFRYGGNDDNHDFIFTGSYQSLTNEDILNNTPKDVVVYGGDCSYNLHTFKLTDSTYFLPNDDLDLTIAADPVTYWKEYIGTSFRGSELGNYEIGRPIPVRAHDQRISVLLESEIRSKYSNKRIHGGTVRMEYHTVPSAFSLSEARTPFVYNYNLDYSLINGNKIFTPKVKLEDNQILFKSRVQYSDQRIYQSRENGFDRFRVGNIYDLDESRGGITRLVNSLDKIYCLQERGLSYIPIQGQIIETSDSGSLSIRNSDIIGIPQYLSTIYGCNNTRTISETPEGFYFVDVLNRKVINIFNGSIAEVSRLNMKSFFDDKFLYYNQPRHTLFGVYDFNRKEYLLLSESYKENLPWMLVFSEITKSWVSNLSTDNIFDVTNGNYLWGDLFMTGKFSGDSISINKMYDDSSTNILGYDITPSLSFYISKDILYPKVFDVFNINSEPSLSDINISTFNTFNKETQSTGMTIGLDKQREGSFRIRTLRDSFYRRLRGLYCRVDLLWNIASTEKPELFAVSSNYRISERKV